MNRDQGPKNRSEFGPLVSPIKVFVSEMPLAATLFALSIPFIVLGTVSSAEWFLILGMIVCLGALLTGMFIE